jgi:hypothetical protein
MGGKTVAHESLLLRNGRSYSYLLLPRKKTSEVGVILAQKLFPAPASRITRMSGALGYRLSFGLVFKAYFRFSDYT